MNKQNSYTELVKIALPITLQSIFQSSYSLVDQIMVGQLGTVSIAGCGLAGKFGSLFSVTLSAVAAVASIMISQYYGSKKEDGISLSFFINFYLAMIIATLFTVPSIVLPGKIMQIYTNDSVACLAAAGYLRIIAISFIPMTITLMLSAMLRSLGYSRLPLYGSVASVLLNIIGNYILIFGKLGMPAMGLNGAAIATLLGRIVEMLILLVSTVYVKRKLQLDLNPIIFPKREFLIGVACIGMPILANEFLWSLGENIYAVIYGRLGTVSLAAMTLTNPVQGMFIGLFSGVSSAAVIMVGSRLGKNAYEDAYHVAKELLKVGAIGSVCISAILILLSRFYVMIFNVSAEVQRNTSNILLAISAVLILKILNMILAGGILRSGGNTKLVLMIDLIGTWGLGIPLGLISAYVFHLPIYWVYFILSQEEAVRLIIAFIFFKKKIWMKNITN